MNNLPRRRLIHLAAAAAALPVVSRIARAQTYPTRPVRLLVGVAAGGGADILARLIGQWLADHLGSAFIIENRPGAGGNIATEELVKAPADGYVLQLAGPSSAINATLYDNLKFNFIRDVTPVANVVRIPLIMEVNPTFPAKTVPEFIAYAKANKSKISMASAGTGTSNHLSGELLKMMTGIEMVHVPYRGAAPALTDLIGGQVQALFDIPSSLEYVRTGKVRALAVTTSTRSEALPDVPAIAEFVPGYETSAWFGVVGSKNTPAEIVDKLNKGINAALADPKLKARLADLGATALPGSPSDFGRFIAEETEKWGKVVKFANIKPE